MHAGPRHAGCPPARQRLQAMGRFAAATIALLSAAATCVLSAGWHDSLASLATATKVEPLAIVKAHTPPLRVPRFDTSGTYPQVRGRAADLRAVSEALRAAVLADQRAYAPYARREQARLPATYERTRPCTARPPWQLEEEWHLVRGATAPVSPSVTGTTVRNYSGQLGLISAARLETRDFLARFQRRVLSWCA